ncbi:MAG: metallophosphoesterase family protein [Planctomycetota bacterium]
MKYAILGDIHGNLDALDVVLDCIEKEKVDEIACVGDIVGYAAEPSACVQRIRDLDCHVVAGNHDYAVLGKTDVSCFNPDALRSVLWTKEHLSKGDLDWLDSLPLTVEHEDFTLAHGTLHSPEYFDYIQTIYDAQLSFEKLDNRVCFLGHSHVPVTFFDVNPIIYTLDNHIKLMPGQKALVNVGSVGQPRDQNPLAAYAIYDAGAEVVRIFRVEYDIDKAAEKIRKAGLPDFNAERLYVGR